MKKVFNQKRILNLVREKPLSRSELIRILRMRPGTVLEAIEELRQKGLIREKGKGKSCGGRRPILLELIPEAHFALGICIRGKDTISVVVDLKDRIVYEEKIKNRFSDQKTLLDYIIKNIEKIFKSTKIPKNKVLGIGLAVPGLVDREKGDSLFSTYYPWWRDVALREPLQKKFRLPVSLENDTRSSTSAERWLGKGKEVDNFFYLDLFVNLMALFQNLWFLFLIFNNHLLTSLSLNYK